MRNHRLSYVKTTALAVLSTVVVTALLTMWSVKSEIVFSWLPYSLPQQSWLYWVVLSVLGGAGAFCGLVAYGGILSLIRDAKMRTTTMKHLQAAPVAASHNSASQQT